jgi:hypothetical protein
VNQTHKTIPKYGYFKKNYCLDTYIISFIIKHLQMRFSQKKEAS